MSVTDMDPTADGVSFNPLVVAYSSTDEALIFGIARRTLENIIESYHRNYDIFAELLQNAVDAVHERWLEEGTPYEPKIWVLVNQVTNEITVCDNGVGIPATMFERVLAPNVSFKDSRQTGTRSFRGHKGVGLSYLAYGFNRLRLSTKTDSFERSALIENGRAWVMGGLEAPPLVVDGAESFPVFDNLSRGTVVTVRLDPTTKPRSLAHLATRPREWSRLLRSQTALGRVSIDSEQGFPLEAEVTVRRPQAGDSTAEVSTTFLYPHLLNAATDEESGNSYLDLGAYYREHADQHVVSNSDKRKHGIYRFWNTSDLASLGFEQADLDWLEERRAWVYGFMSYSADFWKENRADPEKTGSALVVQPGLVFASEGMTIGDYQEISLTRYTGRQRQVACLLHLDGLRPDLGRKSFEDETVEKGQLVARRIVEWFSRDNRHQLFLRSPRDKKQIKSVSLEDWKFEAQTWERSNPLRWGGESFALISEPRQEQDVVILFSQLISRGTLPGYSVLGAAEGNQQYDSLVRVGIDFSAETPFSREYPQGLHAEVLKDGNGVRSTVQVTEFKYDLVDLVRDFNDETKAFNDVDLAVAWIAGPQFDGGAFGDYELLTVSTSQTVENREWPGVSHHLVRSGSDHSIKVILLADLFALKNDWDSAEKAQVRRYRE